jgi:hypothetical protein
MILLTEDPSYIRAYTQNFTVIDGVVYYEILNYMVETFRNTDLTPFEFQYFSDEQWITQALSSF